MMKFDYSKLLLLLVCGYSMANPVLREETTITPPEDKDYRLNGAYIPENYNIHLTIEDEFVAKKKFEGIVEITVKKSARATGKLQLHMDDDIYNNVAIKVNGQILTKDKTTFDKDTKIVEIDHADPKKLTFVYTGTIYEDMYGLYLSKIKGDKYILTTQFQPTYARRAFPCFDEPQYKATFDISITAPTDFDAMSNQPTTGTPVKPEFVFQQTPKMSTYLIAFVVSNLKSLDVVGAPADLPMKVWAPETENAKYAAKHSYNIVKNLGDILGGKENSDIAFQKMNIKHLDTVAIPDFAAGAMENWGLMTFRETALLVSDSNPKAKDQERVATVIAHEFAHSWFGDWVTMEWWQDTWLNEGFATYFESHGLIDVKGMEGFELDNQFILQDIHPIMETDGVEPALPLSSKKEDVNTVNEIQAKFGTITYSKGGTIVRMMEKIVGDRTKFFEILHKYINKYKGKNTTPADLFGEFEDITISKDEDPVKFEEIMKEWVYESGYPVVSASVKGGVVSLTQEQFLYDKKQKATSEKKWYVPITWEWKEIPKPTTTETPGTETTVTNPTGTDPTVTDPTVTDPTGTDPTGTDPTGTDPTGTDPTVTDPTVTDPTGTDPTGTDPTGTDPTGTDPTVTDPTGTDPTGTDPTGTDPTGTDPTVTDPTGTDPTGTDPTGTDPTGTDPTGTDPTGTDPTGTDPTGTDPTGTDPTGTDEPTTAPSETEAPTTAPSETEAPTTAPSETEAPTTAPSETEAPTTASSETEAPTTASSETEAPTTAPSETEAPTTASSETEAPTTAPSETEVPTTASSETEAPTITPPATGEPSDSEENANPEVPPESENLSKHTDFNTLVRLPRDTERANFFFLKPTSDPATIDDESDKALIINLQNAGYYRVKYDDTLWKRIISVLDADHTQIDPLSRAQLINDAMNLARAGEISYTKAFTLLEYLKKETDYYPWQAALTGFSYLRKRLAGDALNKQITDQMEGLMKNFYEKNSGFVIKEKTPIDIYKKVLALEWACELDSGDCVNEANELFPSADEPTRVDKVIDPNLQSIVFCSGLRQTENDENNWDKTWDSYVASEDPAEKVRLLTALGCTKNEEKLKEFLQKSIDSDDIRPQDAASVFKAVLTGNPEGVQTSLDFLETKFVEVAGKYGAMGALSSVILQVSDRITTGPQLTKFKALLDENKEHLGDAAIVVDNALTAAQANMEWASSAKQELNEYLNPKDNGAAGFASTSFLALLVCVVVARLF